MASAIKVRALEKNYGDVKAVDHISFEVEAGEIFCLIGPNGAGKTTTIECIEGLRIPDDGLITVLGLDPIKDNKALSQRVGVQLQENSLASRITPLEVLKLFSKCFDDPLPIAHLLETFGIEHVQNAQYHRLSGGQKRRLHVALALIGQPKIVFLDEPTTGLDPEARQTFWNYLEAYRRKGNTIFVTTHYMQEAQDYCDRIMIMEKGKILTVGAPTVLLEQNDVIMRVTVKQEVVDEALEINFRSLPQISTILVDEHHFTMYGSQDLLEVIVDQLRLSGLSTSAITSRLANLEDLYLILTTDRFQKISNNNQRILV